LAHGPQNGGPQKWEENGFLILMKYIWLCIAFGGGGVRGCVGICKIALKFLI
jgi:hypothetical protein